MRRANASTLTDHMARHAQVGHVPSMLPAFIVSLVVGCVAETAESAETLPSACNGHAELCDRPFNTVTLAGTHNSMSNPDDGFAAPNQPHDLQTQLDAGIRGFLLDTHTGLDGEPALCHGYCELGSVPLVAALAVFRTFLDDHRGEVLAFIIEDAITPGETESAFDAADLTRLTYTWEGDAWPTLGEMVAADTRLVVTDESGSAGPAWYQPAWTDYVDTPYDFSSVDEFSCNMNRGNLENPLFLLNHWVEDPLPSTTRSAEANTAEVLGGRAHECAVAFGRNPNLVAVDQYEQGALFSVVDSLNGVN